MDQPASYALGYTPSEEERLMLQSRVIGELTEALFARAGLAEGMRVLDIGCGTGDVSLLARRFVGESGSVLGIDRSADSLALARRRAQSAGLANVEFQVGSLEALELQGPFDALVGRLILLYLPDPAATLQRLARLVRPGGLIIFQEMDMSAGRAVPPLPLYQQAGNWICTAFQRAGVEIDMGSRLFATYRQAGLPTPQLMSGARVVGGGGDPEFFAWLTGTVSSLLPLLEKLGVATREEVQPDSLAQRLAAEVVERGAVAHSPSFIGAWTRLSE